MIYDCLIIGAGPAGLTAAIYLARFRRHIIIIHNNDSRARLIPLSHNFPGAKEGISGPEILLRLNQQLACYSAPMVNDTVLNLDYDFKKRIFKINTEKTIFESKYVIMATGVIDIEPKLPKVEHAIKKGLLRHCPICDGYEVIDQNIAIIGTENKGIKEALFLQNYSSKLTLFTLGSKFKIPKDFPKNIQVISDPILTIDIANNKISALHTKNKTFSFDTIYSALGSEIRSEIAVKIGAKCLNDKSIVVNKKQQSTIPGLYAIGDVTSALNQMVVGFGQAAIAATEIHNQLSKDK